MTLITYIDERNCKVSVLTDYLSAAEDDALHAELTSLPLIKHELRPMYGKRTFQPRLSMCLGKPYAYSGTVHPCVEWDQAPLAKIYTDQVNAEYGTSFNGGMVNYYPEGKDYISAHSDDESTLSGNKGVYGISTHSERDMVMKWLLEGTRKPDPSRDRVVIPLPPGSLFIMEGDTQKWLTHEMPVRKNAGPRASLTMREFN